MSRSSSRLSAPSTISNTQPSLHRRQDRLPINSFDQDDVDDFSDLEADNDNYPLPPHMSESSRKREALDCRRGQRKVHIQFDTTSNWSSWRLSVTCFHCLPHPTSTDHNITVVPTTIRSATTGIHEPGSSVISTHADSLDLALVGNKPARVGLRSRSFFQKPVKYQVLATRASADVRSHTCFENPMLSADELAKLSAESWTSVQKETQQYLCRLKVVDAHVSADPDV